MAGKYQIVNGHTMSTTVLNGFSSNFNQLYDSVAKSADYVILDDDGYNTLLVTTGSVADVTMTLPTLADNLDRPLRIIKVDSGTKNCIIDGEGAEEISGNLTKTLYRQWDYIVVKATASTWVEIGGNVAETQAKIVERTVETLPATAQTPYFTVTGRVVITQIVGEVVVGFDATAMNLKLISNPTVGAGDVDLCVALAVASDVAGTLYNITGTFANAMIATTYGAFEGQVNPFIVSAGTIDLDNDATEAAGTGSTKWTIHYIPLDAGSSIVVA